MLEAGEPEGRLPDARFALEHDRSQRSPCVADERVEGAQLLLPADYLEHRLIVTEVFSNATSTQALRRTVRNRAGETSCRRVWIPARERAAVNYFRSYDFRHTCATLLLYEGRTLNEVA